MDAMTVGLLAIIVLLLAFSAFFS
ncbi:MAG: hypothetical protein RL477_986, partial [Pseudomonadota bacterium]